MRFKRSKYARPRVEYAPGRNPYRSYDLFNGRREDAFRLYVCLECGAMEEHSFAPGSRKHVMCSAPCRLTDENGVPLYPVTKIPCWATTEDLHGLGIPADIIPVVYALGGPPALKALIDEHRSIKESSDQLSE